VHVSLEPCVVAVTEEIFSVNPGLDRNKSVAFVESADDVTTYGGVTVETVENS